MTDSNSRAFRLGNLRAALAAAVGLLMILAGALTLIGDVQRSLPDSLWYAFADNLFIVCAGIGLALVLADQVARPVQAGRAWSLQVRLVAGALLGVAALLLSVITIHAIWGGLALHDLAVSALLGAGVGLLALALTRPANAPAEPRAPDSVASGPAYAILAIALLASVILRAVAPDMPVQDWITTPLQVLVVPGLGLGLALLPPALGWPERIIAALPLSITAQVVGLMWCDLLGIPAGWLTFTVLGALVTFGGLLGAIVIRWRAG